MARMCLGLSIVLALAVVGGGPALAGEEPARLHVTTDRAHVVVLPGEPFTKLAVANPGVVDVAVINPTQFLLTAKTAGVTSVVVFYPSRIRSFDVIVTPPAIGSASPRLVSEPHAVVIQRAGKVSEQFFARDRDQGWVELGNAKLEADGGKK